MFGPLREHIEYLSDGRRTALFRQAVGQVVDPGDMVADLGCGFGVLGLMCLQAGASEVWGIDRTDAIEIARETMARAGLGERYHCIRDTTFRATLAQPVDLLICDHVGFFGIDYGIVGMVADARKRLLKPGGQVLPRRIRMILAGVSSADARAQVDGWRGTGVPAEFGWLHDYAVNASYNRQFRPEDVVTGAVVSGTVDLCAENPQLLRFEAELVADRDVVLDGIAGWFECELADGIWMTNSPLAADRIERDQLFLPIDPTAPLQSGDRVEVTVSMQHDTALANWKVAVPRTGFRARHSNWKGMILSEADRVPAARRVAALSQAGRARQIVLGYVDGVRTREEIEQTVLHDHPSLFPSEDELRRFISSELTAST